MPTGYTSPVCDGEITDFSDFAIKCARGMGALYHMRDDSMNRPYYPPKISDYHPKALEQAKQKLSEWNSLSEAQKIKRIKEQDTTTEKAWKEHDKKSALTNSRLQSMIDQVTAWTPPTPDHVEFKEFMLSQLTNSLDTYVRNPNDAVIKNIHQYHFSIDEMQQRLERDVKYHEDKLAEEIQRVKWCNDWANALFDSLNNNKINKV